MCSEMKPPFDRFGEPYDDDEYGEEIDRDYDQWADDYAKEPDDGYEDYAYLLGER